MELTQQQKTTLKNYILSVPALVDEINSGHPGTVADAMNQLASPDFYVWRSSVSRSEIYNTVPQPENTSWNWTFYKNQSVPEQNAWTQMFMGDQADFSKPNVRSGITAIFQSASVFNATHAFAVARRRAKQWEKLLASGVGSTVAPATAALEGDLDAGDIEQIIIGG